MLFDALKSHLFDGDTCFLCGDSLNEENRSDEHVFPTWLQHRFNLWDTSLTLLNGTVIPYRQLKIPACRACNNEHLSGLEKRIQQSIFEPIDSPNAPAKHDLYLWTAKILFGCLYKELQLPKDRRQADGERILDTKTMEHFQMLHYFLQSARVPMQFHCQHSDFPASIYLFDLQCAEEVERQFDFRDNPIHHTVLVRLGPRGILAAFDGGAQERTVGDLFRRDAKRVLHPLQFLELGAKLFYKASILHRRPTYLILETGGCHHVTLTGMDTPDDITQLWSKELADGTVVLRSIPPLPLLDKPIFEDWKIDDYAKFLGGLTGLPLESLNPQSGIVMSWLSDAENKPIELYLAQQPW